MNRAYSVLTVKAVEEDSRTIRGTATTPSPDRMDDVVEPLGVEFKNPLPLLWQHLSDKPVGSVKFSKATKNGIDFEAQIAKLDEPGTLKDRLDEAWQSVKLKLVSAVSIGFRPLEYAFMDNGGTRFIRSEVLELSLVTIPANAEATINVIRSIDTALLAASGKSQPSADRPLSPGPSGKSNKPVNLRPKEASTMKTISEQIAALEAKRAANAARMSEIMQKSTDEGRTTDDAERDEFDTLESENAPIEADLKRFRSLEKANMASVKPVTANTPELASQQRQVGPVVQVQRNVEKGIIFTRLLGAKYIAQQHGVSAIDVARSKFGDTPEVEAILKAPVEVGTTTGTTWAAPLVQLNQATSEFIDLLRAATILGRIPGITRVPFNVQIPRATGDPSVNWVGEGKVKPVSSMAFDSITLRWNKVAGIVPITEELMKFSNPAADTLVRNALVAAIAYLTDRDFLDPTKAATDVSPASVTNGVSAITATGTTADALRADIGSLLAAYLSANMSVSGLVFVMTSVLAMRLSLMRNALDQKEFPEISLAGGTLEGVPVIVSENIVAANGSPVDGALIVAINAPEILLAEEGVSVDVSREASLQMETTPDSPFTASTVMVSLWQHNMVGIRAERYITWMKRRSGAVQYINGAAYR